MNTESRDTFKDADALPEKFSGWFAGRGWQARPHQLSMLRTAQAGRSALLIAPTGGGKTLAGFLPSLIDLGRDSRARPQHALHFTAEGAGGRHCPQSRCANFGAGA